MENLKCQLTYRAELCYAVCLDNVPIVSEVVLTNESNTPSRVTHYKIFMPVTEKN